MASLQQFEIDAIDGGDNIVPDLEGKVVLAVNVASRCGLTPQYAGLEQLYEALSEQGFTVVGFPCNQFGAQEPGSEDEIVEFCTTNYGVKFPMTAKIDVNGDDRHPLYAWLIAKFPGDIEWNFEKFLINRDGQVVGRYPPATAPDDADLLRDIADLL